MILPNIWKNKKCSKPQTSEDNLLKLSSCSSHFTLYTTIYYNPYFRQYTQYFASSPFFFPRVTLCPPGPEDFLLISIRTSAGDKVTSSAIFEMATAQKGGPNGWLSWLVTRISVSFFFRMNILYIYICLSIYLSSCHGRCRAPGCFVVFLVSFMFLFHDGVGWGGVGWDVNVHVHVTLKLFHGWSSFWEVKKQACKAARLHACKAAEAHANPLETTRRLSAPFPYS